jgi:chaperone modulatory protein CbpM
MNTYSIAVGICVADDQALDLETFAVACGTDVDTVRQLVHEGLVHPVADRPAWQFGGESIARVRRIRRLQRDFDANLQCVGVMLDLLTEIERLRSRLHRAGLRSD